MADSGGKQTLSMPPPSLEPVVSPPLKTGKEFVLVLARHRMIYRHWDKEEYKPGDEAELVLEGEHVGKKELSLVVEESVDGTDWMPIATIKATPTEEDRVTAKFKIPRPRDVGHITRAEWKREKAKAGEKLGLHVETANYEGAVSIYVERMDADGNWSTVSLWQNQIKSNALDDLYQVPGVAPKPVPLPVGKLTAVRFGEERYEYGDVATLIGAAEGCEQDRLQFILERNAGEGWEQVGSGVATVNGPEAHCPMYLMSGKSKMLSADWKPMGGTDVDLIVTAEEMEFETVTFVLEKQVGNSWVTVGESQATVENGVARVEQAFQTPRFDKGGGGGSDGSGDGEETDPRSDGSDTNDPDDPNSGSGVAASGDDDDANDGTGKVEE